MRKKTHKNRTIMRKVVSVGFILWYDAKTLNYQVQT